MVPLTFLVPPSIKEKIYLSHQDVEVKRWLKDLSINMFPFQTIFLQKFRLAVISHPSNGQTPFPYIRYCCGSIFLWTTYKVSKIYRLKLGEVLPGQIDKECANVVK